MAQLTYRFERFHYRWCAKLERPLNVVAREWLSSRAKLLREDNRNATLHSSRMSKLIYATNTSLDGYVEDETGAFDWVNPDQVFPFITELLRPIGTHLYGRRLYETMAYWDG